MRSPDDENKEEGNFWLHPKIGEKNKLVYDIDKIMDETTKTKAVRK